MARIRVCHHQCARYLSGSHVDIHCYPITTCPEKRDCMFSVALGFFRPVIAFLAASIGTVFYTAWGIQCQMQLASQSFLSDIYFCQPGQTSAQVLLFLPLPRYKGILKKIPSPEYLSSANSREKVCIRCRTKPKTKSRDSETLLYLRLLLFFLLLLYYSSSMQYRKRR